MRDEGPLLLLLHGFPSSSYDWRLLLEELPGRAVLAYDCLGFGLSEKPADHDYSLVEQADIAEALVRRHGDGGPVFFVGHDMGTSVATELMARDLDGTLEMNLVGGLLFNGSMIQSAASPTLGQRCLRGRLGPVMARLSSERFFRHQFGSIFSSGHPLSDEEAADQWCLLAHDGGRALGHKLIVYMDERERYAPRWYGALANWPAMRAPPPLRVRRRPRCTWPGRCGSGGDRERPQRGPGAAPQVPLTRFEDLGHYPQIEDPARLAAAAGSRDRRLSDALWRRTRAAL